MFRIVMISMLLAAGAFSPLVASAQSFPMDFSGKVIYVDDGDTLIMMMPDHEKRTIRLTDVDAPESSHEKYGKLGQPFSTLSGRNLANMAKGKIANAHCYEYDQHERLVCRVVVDGVDVSLAQIQAGLGWANTAAGRKYVRDSRAYSLEEEARRGHRGLWQDARPIPPWEWRRQCWGKGVCENAGS